MFEIISFSKYAFELYFLLLAYAETTETSDNDTIIIQPYGICDPHCVRECEAIFSENPEVCSENCGCDQDLPHEQEFTKKTTDFNKDRILWSIKTNSMKTNTQNCVTKCERFCVSIEGNYEACNIECFELFCENFLESWTFLGVFFLILTLVLYGTWKLIQKSIHDERKFFSYQRV